MLLLIYIIIVSNLIALNSLSFQLPIKLTKQIENLRNIPDDKLRYQQLMYLANELNPMNENYKTHENKVPGCLSTVYIHAIRQDNKIYFQGDADALMTKGLVSLLVNGCSGSTLKEIEDIQPEFIQYSKIANSLTPGRNNGFLNMLSIMKKKAKELFIESNTSNDQQSNNIEVPVLVDVDVNTNRLGKIHSSIQNKLQMLQPHVLNIENESYKHSGHAGMNNIESNESHFNIYIVSDMFQGLSLVQRHKMIYTILNDEMNQGIHALSINAKTIDETK